MLARRAAVPLAALVALAGCLAGVPADVATQSDGGPLLAAFVPPVPDFDFATVVDPDHGGHQVPHLHETGHGLDLVGFAAVQPHLPPGVRGSITQVDVWGDYAVVSGMEGGLAFAIFDISDPAAPAFVSWWPSTSNGWTARFSDDGNYVFYGCQVLGGPFVAVTTATSAQLPKTCDNEGVDAVRKGGVVAVDVSDKANPSFVAFVPGVAAHNLQTAHIAGHDWIFTNGVDIVRFDREAGALEVVANVQGVHDATVARHPVTGDWLLYTGTDQLAIFNVNDPASPQPVFDGGLEGIVGWHEQTPIPGLVDGRYVMALAGESFLGTSGVRDVLRFVDLTDPANPQPLGEWRAPWNPKTPWASYLWSVHEIAATPTGQVAVAWYHGGAWVVDVSTKERQDEPVTLAAYQPHEPLNTLPSMFVQTPVPVVPFVWGVGWDDRGYLVVPDMHTGLHVLEPAWGLVTGVDGGQ